MANAAGLTETELLKLLAVLDFDLARYGKHLEETVKLTTFCRRAAQR
jgi:hypothetical protein